MPDGARGKDVGTRLCTYARRPQRANHDRSEPVIARALCAFLLCAWAPRVLAQPLSDPPPPPPPPPVAGDSDQLPPPAPPLASSSREGFTLGLSFGLGVGSSPRGLGLGSSRSFGPLEVGLGGINLELGGFFSPTFALVFKTTGVTTVGDVVVTRGIWAVAAQVWATDILKIEAGPGLHYMAGVGASGGGFDTAFGLYLAPAIQLVEFERGHSLQAAIEATNGFYEGGSAQTVALVLAWQSL